MIAAGAFVLATLAYARWHAFTSDDVAIQNIVSSVLQGNPLAPALGNDNFITKVPIYLLVGALLPNGTAAVALTVVLCSAPLIVALLVIAHRMLIGVSASRRVAGGALVCAYLASQLAEFAPTMQPNGRNGEIGVALLLLWWRFGMASGGRRRTAVWSLLAVAAWVLLFFSDLFFLFVLVPSVLVVVVVVLARGDDRRPVLRASAEIVIAAALAWWLLGRAQAAGFVITQNFSSGTPAAKDVPAYVAAAVGAMGRDLNADLWGEPLGLALLPSAVQLAVVAAVIALAVRVLVSGTELRDRRLLVLAVTAVLNLVLYVMTSNAADDLNFRYVFFAAVLLLLIAVRAIAVLPPPDGAFSARAARLCGWALVAVVGFGIVVNASAVARSSGSQPQARTKQIIALAEQHGASVGVGSYWDANVTTYFSEGRVRVLPQACSATGYVPFGWLINVPDLRQRARATFVVLSAGTGCTADAAQASFGTPSSEAELAGGDRIWFYDGPLTR